jgi:hypothetical protein
MFIALRPNQMILHPSGVTCFAGAFVTKKGCNKPLKFVDIVSEELWLQL